LRFKAESFCDFNKLDVCRKSDNRKDLSEVVVLLAATVSDSVAYAATQKEDCWASRCTLF